MSVKLGTPIAEAIVTVDRLYGAMARITVMSKEHSEHVLSLLRKELETCEAHERTFIQSFIRYVTVENTD